jgi:hypothetical protein
VVFKINKWEMFKNILLNQKKKCLLKKNMQLKLDKFLLIFLMHLFKKKAYHN